MKTTFGKIGCIAMLIVIGLSQTSCAFSLVSQDTSLMMENHSPNPPIITGPTSGRTGRFYNYNFLLTDPDGDDLSAIYIDWGFSGGGNTTYICWTCGGSNKPNGTVFAYSYSWPYDGTFTVRAKIYDTSHNESDWGTLTVTMPSSYDLPFLHLWERLFERFPHAFPLLRHRMGY